MGSDSDAKDKLGELFIIGFEGTQLSDDTSAFLSQAGIGGVILFSHNYENPSQLAELSCQLQDSRADLPLWISVDQEGGRVQRFKEGFTIIPPAEKIGLAESPKLVFEVAELMAKELSATGINLNFCPVADILTNPDNKVIGDRAYGTDPDKVSRIVTAMVRGHVTNGVQACVKHFPGHGDTLLDSHEALPEVEKSWDDLREVEIKPFVKTFKSRCSMVMVSHILNKAIDPDYPASLSKKTLTDLLRNDLRYSKIIITDDLEMKAVTDKYPADEVPILAIEAGADLLVYRSEDAGRRAYSQSLKALEEGRLSVERVLESADRLLELKEDYLADYTSPDPRAVGSVCGSEAHQEIISRL